MNMVDIIMRKKNKHALSYDELEFAFLGYLKKEIPDYQMSALLMAIALNGMNITETIALTDIFIKSGDRYNLGEKMRYVVDKHSTGGVGDTTTLIVGPLCASLGLKMAKMSGRGLGTTGGTIDKVKSIPGFNVDLDEETFVKQVSDLGFALSSQTPTLVPLDKVIYELRDVTGTTESIPLIASSIMSKKIAVGAKDILIDIKVGSGALIKNREDGKLLSEWLTTIGESFHCHVKTILSDMNSPLSRAVGNALEVAEAVGVLHGKVSPLYYTSVEIAANLLAMAKNMSYEEAQIRTEKAIKDGTALKYFYKFVKAQGGDLSQLTLAEHIVKVKAQEDGTILELDALGAAKLAAKLGAARMKLDDDIDYGVGLYFKRFVGDEVHKGDTILYLYINDLKIKFNQSDFDFIKINNMV